jgi:hypothetical protein
VLYEFAVGRDAAAAQEVEVDPHVHAALAEVPVGRAGETVPAEQLVEPAQVVAKALRRNRGVLPAAPGLGAVGPAGGEPRRIRPAPPQHPLRPGIGDE